MAKKVRKGSALVGVKKELKQLREKQAEQYKWLSDLIGKQERRVHQVESKFEGLQGFHQGLVKAISVALEKVDARFAIAKQGFRYIFPVLWRLEDFMGPKHLLKPAIVNYRNPFPDDACVEPLQEFRPKTPVPPLQ